MLFEGKFSSLLIKILSQTEKYKYHYLYEAWNYGLSQRSLKFLATVLDALSGKQQ